MHVDITKRLAITKCLAITKLADVIREDWTLQQLIDYKKKYHIDQKVKDISSYHNTYLLFFIYFYSFRMNESIRTCQRL